MWKISETNGVQVRNLTRTGCLPEYAYLSSKSSGVIPATRSTEVMPSQTEQSAGGRTMSIISSGTSSAHESRSMSMSNTQSQKYSATWRLVMGHWAAIMTAKSPTSTEGRTHVNFLPEMCHRNFIINCHMKIFSQISQKKASKQSICFSGHRVVGPSLKGFLVVVGVCRSVLILDKQQRIQLCPPLSHNKDGCQLWRFVFHMPCPPPPPPPARHPTFLETLKRNQTIQIYWYVKSPSFMKETKSR